MKRTAPDDLGSAADAKPVFLPHEPNINDGHMNFLRIRCEPLWEQLYERRRQVEIATRGETRKAK